MSDDYGAARQGSKVEHRGAPCDEPDELNESSESGQDWVPVAGNAIAAEQVSRRGFLQGATLLAGGLAATAVPGTAAQAQEVQRAQRATVPVRLMPLSLTINGEKKDLQVDPRISLLDLLREQLALTGTKKGCDHGQCGSCTVIAGGRRINSCLSLALVHSGDTITTVEGLAKGDELHPVQAAFLEHDGYQCGYCTPGQVVSAVALLDEVARGEPSQVTPLRKAAAIELTTAEIKERMSGNLCRCGAYPGIVAAVQQAYKQRTQTA